MLAMILRTLAAAMTVILVACGAAADPQQQQQPQQRQQADADPSTDLAGFVNSERLAQRLPGLAVVIARSDGPPRTHVSGERRIGKGDPIASSDRMHLASLTKAITATLIGALTEKQLMKFETTIGQAFPELAAKIQPSYRNVSVRQLLTHTGGIPPYRTRESMQSLATLKGTPTEQRYAFVERVLNEPPRFEPGARHEYSNAGAAIAGAMAERIGGASYQQLVQQFVFAPLGGRAAFGNPGLAAEPQPWGHIRALLGSITEVAPADAVFTTPVAMEPAGDASPSIQDYGRFLQLHLRGLRGRDDVLKATTIQELHKRGTSNDSASNAAMGWALMPRDGVESHEHVGSYGAYVAYATIQPSRDIAVAAFGNLGGGQDLRNAVAMVALRIATRVAAAEKSH